MNRRELTDSVDNYISGISGKPPAWKSEGSTRDRFYEKTLKRLHVAYELARNDARYQGDLLLALRDYLIVFRTDARFDMNHAQGGEYGLSADPVSRRIHASLALPDYIRDKGFVEDAFQRGPAPEDGQTELVTDSAIYSLTGFRRFKSLGQKLAVYGALNTPGGYTTLISLPTGAGKSLVTQVIAFQRDGLTVAVVPTVSLAIDQVRSSKSILHRPNIENEVFYYASGVDTAPILKAIKAKTARLLFISPEALLENKQFGELIKEASSTRYLKNLVIDEAHAVVDWGDSFRVEYQCLDLWRRSVIAHNPMFRTYLLSATFDEPCVSTLQGLFSQDDRWIEIRCDALRKEPRFILTTCRNQREKESRIVELVRTLPHPMIIYVAHPQEAEATRRLLKEAGLLNVRTFTGKTTGRERRDLIDSWIDDQFPIMVATSAFGMGVDKRDVRTVLHTYVPQNPNSYYQELGRGGRDGLACLSVMCIHPDDVNISFSRISKKVMTPEKIAGRWKSMFESPTTKRSGGTVYIDTSVKPSYNVEDKDDDMEASEADVNWNTYVLLLLKRYGMLSLEEIVKSNGEGFTFVGSVANDVLLEKDERLTDAMRAIRETEWNSKLDGLETMKRTIKEGSGDCWSEMFYKTYSLVTERCAGCANHTEQIGCKDTEYPLRLQVSTPVKTLSPDQKKVFGHTREAVIFAPSESYIDALAAISRLRPTIIVSPIESLLDTVISSARPPFHAMLMKPDEFVGLANHGGKFFNSGLAVVFYGRDPGLVLNTFNRIQKNTAKYPDLKVIHVVNNNYYFDRIEKSFTDLVDGPVVPLASI